MKEKRWFPVFYMFIVTAVFSSAVIGFSQYTQERVQANQQRNFELAVLNVLPGMYVPGMSSLQLHKEFEDKVDEPTDQTAGAYTLRKDGAIEAYALPIEGRGFWAEIKAVIGIEPDLKTITGFVVYEQRETPGLGAEISKKEFTRQFDDLEMSTQGKPITFRRPGEELKQGQVHAVTGATQTSVRLEKIINDSLDQWRQKIENQ
ncbi:MAG: FMN-binding protein [Sedimentisphaerales bacterium]